MKETWHGPLQTSMPRLLNRQTNYGASQNTSLSLLDYHAPPGFLPMQTYLQIRQPKSPGWAMVWNSYKGK